MREILFRGKTCYNGDWVFGDLMHSPVLMRGKHVIKRDVTLIQKCGRCGWNDVNPDTVGQYTGLKDNNDVKIFEGDIVEFEDAFADCEGYHDHTFTNQGIVEYTKFGMTLYFTDRQVVEMDDLFYEGKADCKVVGNIYDNPELLNGDANG